MNDKFLEIIPKIKECNFSNSGIYALFVFLIIPIIIFIPAYIMIQLNISIWPILLLPISIYWWIYLWFILPRKTQELLCNKIIWLQEMHTIIYNPKTIKNISLLNEILHTTEEIYSFIKTLVNIRKYLFIFFPISFKIAQNKDLVKIYKNTKLYWSEVVFLQELQSLIKSEIHFTLVRIQDLRSDLAIRLSEQQKQLKSAKSEVEKNITWTTELNHVSELQRARLDRQIEQFEELQRVLVKV